MDTSTDTVRAAAPALLAALKALIADIDTGVLVRDTTHDGDPEYLRRMVAFTRRLTAAMAAIAQAEGR